MTTLQADATKADKDRLTSLPFPFPTEHYRYSTNVEPARVLHTTAAGGWGRDIVVIDDDYRDEIELRAEVLRRDPTRSAVLDHMRPAAWDAVMFLLRELVSSRPDDMKLASLGDDRWRWQNDLLGTDVEFVYGDDASLPDEPLRWVSGQVQEDVALLDHREGQLFVDAGVVTFAADWSFGFDVGMSFLEIHGPVPRVRQMGVITRAQEFLMRLEPSSPYRRTNWTMTIGRRLDVSTETYPEWGPDRDWVLTVDDQTFAEAVHLRIEVQHLIRLPESDAVMFLIRTYLASLSEIAEVAPWRDKMASVLAELPPDMAEYKGIVKYKDRAAGWLQAQATRETAGAAS